MDVKATLNSKTVAELRKIAAQRNIAGRSTMKKADLISELIASDVELLLAIDEITPEQEARFAEQYNAAKFNADTLAIANAEADAVCEREKNATAPEARVKIERNRPGGALASFFIDGGVRNAWVNRVGKSWVLVDSFEPTPIRVRATTFGKLAKLWGKKVGVVVEEIDVVKTF